jgi:putative transposase
MTRLSHLLMYKGLKNEQLTIKIRAHRTSQECSRCGHTLPDNRETPTVFTCQNCGFTTNADYNASLIIKNRRIRVVLGGTIVAKQKTSVRFRQKVTKIRWRLPESKRASMDCCTMDGLDKTG